VAIVGIYDHYELLGVTPAATTEEINAAYRTLAKRLHPDVVGEASTALFAMVADARAVLTDPERRARYDRARQRPAGTVARPQPTRPREPEPEPDYVDEDTPPRPPPPSWDAGSRPSSYPPPTYQTYFGRSRSYPPPTYQTYFGRPSDARRNGPYPSSSARPGRPLPPRQQPRSPGRLLLLIARGVAKATIRYNNRKQR
jgi:curved DNA-binding protein CbpA